MRTKTILKTLAVALLMPAMLLTTACSSDDNDIVNTENPANTQKGYTLPVTVNVTRQGDDATRATYNESTKKLSFSTGDKLLVTGNHSDAGNFAGTLDYDAVSGKFSGILTLVNDYTGTIDALMANAYAFLLPAGYESYKFFSVSGSSSSPMVTFDYTKAFALTKAAAVEQFSLEYATSYSSGFALAPMNAIASFTISGLTANKTVAVSFDTSVSGIIIGGNVTTNATGVATFAVGVSPNRHLENCTLTVDGNNIALPTKTTEAGHIYNISRSVAAAPAVPTGAISGQFTVNSNGDKVYFSKGNLQLSAANTWKFADNQWEYFGDSQSDNHRDLFGWGTGNNPNQTSTNNSNYSSFTDWGTAAASSIGSGWRTLSKDEWVYLFNTRTVNNGTGSGKSYTLGQNVNGKLGVVLYPDDYTGELYTTAKSANWSDFESAGCVFLPAAGFRNGTSVNLVGSDGYYWSSTAYGTDYAYRMRYVSGVVDPTNYSYRLYGHSVRLVHDVPAGSQGTQANDRSYGDQSNLDTW